MSLLRLSLERRFHLPLIFHLQEIPYRFTQNVTYVLVKMKWKKDTFYDSIEIISKSLELRAIISLKNCIIREPGCCIPISAVSKRGYQLDVPAKVAKFLRRYPSFFEEYTGEKYNLPWFRLTPEAIDLHKEERSIYENCNPELVNRLKKMLLLTTSKQLPLKIIKGMRWYLGLPDEFVQDLENNANSNFELFTMEDELRGVRVLDRTERVLSQMQKISARTDGLQEVSYTIPFPLYPSKGLRLKRKILDWLNEFQQLPYISPYADSSHLNPNSDISEKRVVGVLHELLSLFVDHSAQRKKLFCLRKHLGLPQKFYKVFERHPHIFYLSPMNKTCTVILKEAYSKNSALEEHPILVTRKKYVMLMNKSEAILKQRRNRSSTRVRSSDLPQNVEASKTVVLSEGP